MTFLRAGFLLAVAAWVQAVLPVLGAGGGVTPPVLLALTLHYALVADRQSGIAVAALCGTLNDAMGFLPLGVSAIGFVLVAEAWRTVRELLFVNHAVTHILIGAITAAVVEGLTGLLLGLGGYRPVTGAWWLTRVGMAALVGGATAPWVMGVLSRVPHVARPGWRAR